jgi:hypothetical protein
LVGKDVGKDVGEDVGDVIGLDVFDASVRREKAPACVSVSLASACTGCSKKPLPLTVKMISKTESRKR